jgi:hypothetical protein
MKIRSLNDGKVVQILDYALGGALVIEVNLEDASNADEVTVKGNPFWVSNLEFKLEKETLSEESRKQLEHLIKVKLEAEDWERRIDVAKGEYSKGVALWNSFKNFNSVFRVIEPNFIEKVTHVIVLPDRSSGDIEVETWKNFYYASDNLQMVLTFSWGSGSKAECPQVYLKGGDSFFLNSLERIILCQGEEELKILLAAAIEEQASKNVRWSHMELANKWNIALPAWIMKAAIALKNRCLEDNIKLAQYRLEEAIKEKEAFQTSNT